MTYVGNSSRSGNRVLITLVVVAILVVAVWAMTGGFDQIQVAEAETPVVSG